MIASENYKKPQRGDGLNGGNKGVVQHQRAGGIFIEDTAQGETHRRRWSTDSPTIHQQKHSLSYRYTIGTEMIKQMKQEYAQIIV